MDDSELDSLGRKLADRHRAGADPEPEESLLNYAESSRVGDWSMRSALVRLALPEPERVSALLEQVRRLEAVLHHVARPLEQHTVVCDRELEGVVRDGSIPEYQIVPYPDTRTADLARIARALPVGCDAVLDAYRSVHELDREEIGALPLLGVALELDDLATDLARWAHDGAGKPPVDRLDGTVERAQARLDELGVPVESGPPPGRGRNRGI